MKRLNIIITVTIIIVIQLLNVLTANMDIFLYLFVIGFILGCLITLFIKPKSEKIKQISLGLLIGTSISFFLGIALMFIMLFLTFRLD